MELNAHRGRVSVKVDEEEEGGFAQAVFLLTAESQLFFGGRSPVGGTWLKITKRMLASYVFFLLWSPGCPAGVGAGECSNPFDVFQGCMQLLSIDNQLVDLMAVQQRLLGNYTQLLIDMCAVIDRSESIKATATLVHSPW